MRTLKNVCNFILLVSLCQGCVNSGSGTINRDYPESFKFSVANRTDLVRKDVAIFLNIDKVKEKYPDFNSKAFIVLHKEQELASQADDLNGDGNLDEVTFITDFAANEEKLMTIRYAKMGEKLRNYPKRTQAEVSHKVGGKFVEKIYVGGEFQNVQYVRVPPEHTDHDTYFRYEGPGWESDKIGYRFYLDWRNAVDIFGKKTSEMVLQRVGLDGFDSYHEMADWGMDIFKVGESMGIGSIGMWHSGKVYRVSLTDSIICEIVANGPVRSQIRTQYFGWKVGLQSYDLTSDLSITAGSRVTRHTVRISGNPPNLCTGLAKHENCTILRPSSEMGTEWQYFGLYGQQSLAGDKLGIAILYKKSDLIELTEDDLSHLVILKPAHGELTYYFLAGWEEEPNGIKSVDEFHQYLKHKVLALSNSFHVTL